MTTQQTDPDEPEKLPHRIRRAGFRGTITYHRKRATASEIDAAEALLEFLRQQQAEDDPGA